MLESIKVKNVALIDETEVTFQDGLNILTGETGAGKSILIDSINLALGARADKGLIRDGQEYAFVELCFLIKRDETIKQLKQLDIFLEDGRVILQRKITPEKNICKINGETVTGRQLKQVAALLIDIHGQHEHQTLLDEKKHLGVVDQFCGNDFAKKKEEFAKAYQSYKELQKQYEQALLEDGSKERELSLARFEVDEITNAQLTPGEDEQLEKEYKKLENFRSIGEKLSGATMALNNFEEGGVLSLLDIALKSVQEAQQFEESLSEHLDNLIQARELVQDSSRGLNQYLDNMEFDGQAYQTIGNRLDTINKLKLKYGNTIEDILEYLEKQEAFLHKYDDFESYKQELSEKVSKSFKEVLEVCEMLSRERAARAKALQKQMQEALLELNFPYAQFEIALHSGEEYLQKTGYDEVQFLISLNAGATKKPLAQVASGGELSRVMLALKSVMADQDEMESLIFDEIDAGISGITAWKVSEKMEILGKEHQLICITHLPQIAAMADTHFLIEKSQSKASTKTELKVLDEEGSICEIARLLGSDVVTDAVLQNAKELKEKANQVKVG